MGEDQGNLAGTCADGLRVMPGIAGVRPGSHVTMSHLGSSQMVRHRALNAAIEGSIPSSPAIGETHEVPPLW